MKIGVAGLWHLGVMYSVGFAELGNHVIAYDPEASAVARFQDGELRVYEPGLQEMLLRNTESGRLRFTSDERELGGVDILILAYDTPVDENDHADIEYVFNEFDRIVEQVDRNTHVMITSQLPVGSSDRIANLLRSRGISGRVTVQPENLRLGKAIESFFNPNRVVVGTIDGEADPIVSDLFAKLNTNIVWMHSKSAEVTKHALNAFLATSVTFMGELAEICEVTGADAKEVEIGLKSDPRIGSKAYLSPGLGFAGGTLARDVTVLSNIQSKLRSKPAIFTSLVTSNRHNNDWIIRALESIQSIQPSTRICFWGISYVESTNTLRRSEIYELIKMLLNSNHQVSYVENFEISEDIDPRIQRATNIEDSVQGVEILIVSKKLSKHWDQIKSSDIFSNRKMWILDPSRHLLALFPSLIDNPKYLSVGTPRR
jgi:UDPglucose 6-dehydrogenase